jgi:hypothetical protein
VGSAGGASTPPGRAVTRTTPLSSHAPATFGPRSMSVRGPFASTGSARGFHVHAGDGDLDWTVEVGSTPVARPFNGVGFALPNRAWRSRAVRDVMSRVAGTALSAGRVRLTGLAPNGQRFVANPLTMWVATDSKATVRGIDVGEMGPAPSRRTSASSAFRRGGCSSSGARCSATLRSDQHRVVPAATCLRCLTPGRRRPGGR